MATWGYIGIGNYRIWDLGFGVSQNLNEGAPDPHTKDWGLYWGHPAYGNYHIPNAHLSGPTTSDGTWPDMMFPNMGGNLYT